MGDTFRALFDDADDGRLLQAIYDTIGPCPEDDTPEEHRIFLLAYDVAGQVSCGGLSDLLHNFWGELDEAIRAFETVGLPERAEILRGVAALFPGGRMPEVALSPEQRVALDTGIRLYMTDVVPELGTWVRAHRDAFQDHDEDWVTELYEPGPTLEPPAAYAGVQDVAEWLQSRNVRLGFDEIRHEYGATRTLNPRDEIPEQARTLVELRFAYDRRDNAETLDVLSRWSGRGSLEAVELDDGRLNGMMLGSLAAFPALRRLNLRCARFSVKEIGRLAALEALEELTLRGIPVVDEDLWPLAALSTLRTLDVGVTRVRGEVLGSFRSLRDLTVGHFSGMDGSLTFLENLESIEDLVVAGAPLAAGAVARIAARPVLRSLRLWDTGLGEAALTPLRGHGTLRSLYLQGMKLTEAGAEILAEIPRLEALHIGDVEKPAAMLARLRARRPDVKVPR